MSNGEPIKLIEHLLTLPAHISRMPFIAMHNGCFVWWIDLEQFVDGLHYFDGISMFLSPMRLTDMDFQRNKKDKNWKQSKKMTSDHTRCGKRQWNQSPSTKWNCRHHLLFCFMVWTQIDNLFGYCWVCLVLMQTKTWNLFEHSFMQTQFSVSSFLFL